MARFSRKGNTFPYLKGVNGLKELTERINKMGLGVKYGEDWKTFLEDFIPYLEKTSVDDWCVDVVRNGKGDCLFGHLSNFCGHKDNDRVDLDFEWFEYFIASTYMVYPINDGKDKRYPQSSAKERCVSYLKDILNGKELTSFAWLKIDEEASLRNTTPYIYIYIKIESREGV